MESAKQSEIMFPEAKRDRWQPIRGGLLNIYRYDYQEFRYEDGRLLLRGNNGTGKSRVFALQLPFLLDGEIVPQRVEPDGDPAKRMEWNLLLGGRHDDRLGYTWLEFGRLNPNGESEFKTLGCALRAVQGRGIAQQWFFITSQRIGRDLFLENEHAQPLSKAKLEAAIGSKGRVFGSGKMEEDRREYRNAVDQALFCMGDRYGALLNLLIQLRQPQLSRTLNEQRLSDALSQALPPLSPAVLGDVAEAFRSLEADRQELDDFLVARDSAEKFLKEYRRYVQIAARRRGDEVRRTNSAYETVMRRLRAAEKALELAESDFKHWAGEVARLDLQEQAARAAEATLRDSPEMKDAKALDRARLDAESAREAAAKAETETEAAATALRQELAFQKEAEGKTSAQQHQVEMLKVQAQEKAATAGLDQRHRDAMERLDKPPAEAALPDPVARALREIVHQRIQGARHIEKLNQAVEQARQEWTSAQKVFLQIEAQLNESIDSEREALAERDREISALFEAVRAWSVSITELQSPDTEETEFSFTEWCEAPEGESPVASMVKRLEQEATGRLQAQQAEAGMTLKSARERVEVLNAELQRLRGGHHEPPPAPHTRDLAARATRPGAPLWALCDFRSSVPEGERASLEAALEAASLLDAWVTPDGRLLDANDHDTMFTIRGAAARPTPNLLDLLQPCIDLQHPQAHAVHEDTVLTVLREIGFGEGTGPVWVDCGGRWQVGPLRGAWNKPAPQHIGHASREEARRQRIRQLEAEMATAEAAVAAIQEEIRHLAERLARAHKEAAEAPTDGNVRRALVQVDVVRGNVGRMRSRLAQQESKVAETRERHTQIAKERDQNALDLGLSAWIDKAAALIEACQNYSQVMAEFWPAIHSLTEARAHFETARQRVGDARTLQERRDQELHASQGKSKSAATVFQTLESTVGVAVREIQDRLAEAGRTVIRIQGEKTSAQGKVTEKAAEKAVEQNKIQEANSEMETKEKERGVAISGLIAFVNTRQLAVAHSELGQTDAGPWSPTRAVDLARRIEAALEEINHDDKAWDRSQKEIHGHFELLQSSLRAHGYMPEASMSDGLFIVTIHFQGRPCSIAELRDTVVGIIQERQELLDAREREVLENYLIDEVAGQLHDLLHYALRWKEEINDELHQRPMSTGLTLRFIWEPLPDLPATFSEARRLLLSARGTWSSAERAAVGGFLQQQIKAVRAANEAGTWQDHLAEAFDYRKWHQFGVERKQDGAWRRLTRRTHGTGSGGEKAIALTLPQLAAAAAHYRSADISAPRLILLDEVFVGVDKNMRAKCMDLLRVFDLDVVMTSESEWACYPTVPAIAIYQLSARDGIDAVYAARWVWNGRKRIRDESPSPEPRPAAGILAEETS